MIRKWLISIIQEALYTECKLFIIGTNRSCGSVYLLTPPPIGSHVYAFGSGGVVESVHLDKFANVKYYSVFIKAT